MGAGWHGQGGGARKEAEMAAEARENNKAALGVKGIFRDYIWQQFRTKFGVSFFNVVKHRLKITSPRKFVSKDL